MWSNLFLLFWLSLFPIVTAWIGRYPRHTLPALVFGVVALGAALAYSLLVRRIIRVDGTDSAVGRSIGSDRKGYLSLALYAAGIGLAFVTPVAVLRPLRRGRRRLVRPRPPAGRDATRTPDRHRRWSTAGRLGSLGTPHRPDRPSRTQELTMPIDTFFAFSGVYADVDDALADYDAVHLLHTEAGLIDAYDAAVVERQERRQGEDRQEARDPHPGGRRDGGRRRPGHRTGDRPLPGRGHRWRPPARHHRRRRPARFTGRPRRRRHEPQRPEGARRGARRRAGRPGGRGRGRHAGQGRGGHEARPEGRGQAAEGRPGRHRGRRQGRPEADGPPRPGGPTVPDDERSPPWMRKVVLVSGASSGIGRACADHLAGRGWTVVGASRRTTARGGVVVAHHGRRRRRLGGRRPSTGWWTTTAASTPW